MDVDEDGAFGDTQMGMPEQLRERLDNNYRRVAGSASICPRVLIHMQLFKLGDYGFRH